MVQSQNECEFHLEYRCPSFMNFRAALSQLATIPGISRVLTRYVYSRNYCIVYSRHYSGGSPTVLSSLGQLEELLEAAPTHLTIMPGSGISAASIQEVIKQLRPHGLHEVHMSGGYWQSGRAVWQRHGMGMGGSREREWDIWVTSYENVRAVRAVLDSM